MDGHTTKHLEKTELTTSSKTVIEHTTKPLRKHRTGDKQVN